MQIQIGRFMAKPHNIICYPSTFAQALEDLCEPAVKDDPGIYDVKEAVAAAKRIERGIERAAKAALEGGAE